MNYSWTTDEAVALRGTPPDEKGRVYSTQWSSIYDLDDQTLTLVPDRGNAVTYRFSMEDFKTVKD